MKSALVLYPLKQAEKGESNRKYEISQCDLSQTTKQDPQEKGGPVCTT